MTIDKVVEIANVGRFMSCRPRGNVALKPLTIVYAENGRGKTTLSTILRSLGLDDSMLLVERTAVAGSGAPKVILLVDGKPVTGDSTSWSSSCPEIDVFDASFVETNVFSGSAVGPDHRRNLHGLAIGAKGVGLAKRVEELAAEITAANGPLKIAEDAVCALAGDDTTAARFCRLSRVANVDQRIEAVTRELKTAESKSLVERTNSFASIKAPAVPIAAVTTHLGATLEGVSEDAVAQTRQHIADHLDESGEQWLDQGLGYLGGGKMCPFCGQGVQGIPLVQAYRQYFDDVYAEHVAKAMALAGEVKERTSPAVSAEIQRVIDENAKVAAVWASLGVGWTAPFDTADLQDQLHKLGEALRDVLGEKSRRPLDAVSPSAKLAASVRRWGEQLEAIDEYNAAVQAANEAIARLKAGTGATDASALRSDLGTLKMAKLRYESASVKACDTYLDLLKEKKQLERTKDQAWKDLEAESKRMIDAYAAKINVYLERFGAQFKICDPTGTRHAGTPRLDYCIDIDGCSIPLGAKTAGQACFGNTLSAGDKSALAFAFYLAKLRSDPDLTKKIVVLDDPICSLDFGRKASTRQEIAALMEDTSQVILMSHDALFLRDVWNVVEPADRAALKVARDGRDSTIAAFDIDRETQAQHYGDYVRVSEYVSGAGSDSPKDVARSLRPLLEGHLRLRFPDRVPKRQLGGFLQDVEDAVPSDPIVVLKPQLAEIRHVNDYAKMFHHDENLAADSQPVNEAELLAYSKRALRVVSQVLVVGLTT